MDGGGEGRGGEGREEMDARKKHEIQFKNESREGLLWWRSD